MAWPASKTIWIDGVTELEAAWFNDTEDYIGITGSADPASLTYLLTNPLSQNPGHKHPAAALVGGADSDILWKNPATHLWETATPDVAGLVAKAGIQSIGGVKTFSDITYLAQVGINTGGATPATKLHVAESITTSPRGIMSAQYNTGTDGARFHMRKARGTQASPVVVVSGDMLGRLVASGYDGSNYLEMAAIEMAAAGTIAATRVPTRLAFLVATDVAPSVLTERMCILPNGYIGMNTPNPVNPLDVLGASYIQLRLTETKVDSTLNRVGLVAQHYEALEEPLGMILGRIDGTTGEVYIGGGAAGSNAATSIVFFSAANNITITGTRRATFNSSGVFSLGTITGGTISGTGKLHMNADTFRLDTARTPASAGAAGNAGEICWDANYLHIAVATNTWTSIPWCGFSIKGMAGIPIYVNNAAAIAGGLGIGSFYRTNADPDPVCVVH